jgi:hypothetical protein
MKTRSLVLAALGAVFVLGAAAPAFADRDDWRRHESREHEWREHEWREHQHWRQDYYVPRAVYYAPPPYYSGPRW